MNEERTKGGTGWAIALGVGLAPFAAVVIYIGGYYMITKAIAQDGPRAILWHVYPSEWQADLFRPAAKVESWLRRHQIETNCFAYSSDQLLAPLVNRPRYGAKSGDYWNGV